ncbi:MAG: CinA family nicotinamide mononucleotide deamidase-related protein [Egibacteraceae bacterium]
MRAELIAVGSELLLGESVDTNSAWIASRLAEIGVDVHRHTTVGDNVARMTEAIREALGRADAVVLTGGLGPTHDDLTRDAVAAVAGVPLERRARLVEYLRDYFARAGRDMPERNLVQADLPVGARVLDAIGTAAGFALDVDTRTIYALPGVPREMRAMIARDVIGDLKMRGGLATTVSRVVRTAGMSESAVADVVGDLVARLDAEAKAGAAGVPTIAFLASRGETKVRVTAKADTRILALARLDPVVDELVVLLGRGVAGMDDEGGEFAVARALSARVWTLAAGESITGGALGARLVRVPGASEWFRGALVTYATPVKADLAGVDAELLAQEGPVSEATVAALAVGARDRMGADVGVAVVGVAGPSPQGGMPVGTVCVAAVLPGDEPVRRTVRLPVGGMEADSVEGLAASRTEVQEWAASVALEHLRRTLTQAGVGRPGERRGRSARGETG